MSESEVRRDSKSSRRVAAWWLGDHWDLCVQSSSLSKEVFMGEVQSAIDSGKFGFNVALGIDTILEFGVRAKHDELEPVKPPQHILFRSPELLTMFANNLAVLLQNCEPPQRISGFTAPFEA